MVVVCVSEFQKVYNCLDITLIERGESYYQEMMTKVVKEFDERGVRQRTFLSQKHV